ncbi:Bifunctional protein GlmU [Pirellulimonas nuda]|uniref:Bifunctional protein GlmU n=1 Tax=Pirellulimonas nuda TaxID=2528009 RepID=A0A518D8A1_9BACT|nr:NTP transferase domain-containing protein [Pirellulimonas nuda]QDU87712.1 Bifunctional protein GlmU [Pirellulimonas nuda]
MSAPLAIVLAAGKGTRMKSELPKVLTPARGRPLVQYVVDALREAGVRQIVAVVGYRSELVEQALAGQSDIAFAQQTEQLGTGHAVMQCRSQLAGWDGPVVVVTGDSPMLRPASVKKLLARFDAPADQRPACVIGTAHREDPTGLGRIVRDASGQFQAIVEQRDATPEQQRVTEVNMSTYVFDAPALLSALDRLTTANAQAEYYVTDGPGILLGQGRRVEALPVLEACESLSVNTPEDLAKVEEEMKRLGMGKSSPPHSGR